MECATFKKVTKVFDGKVHSKEFSIECAVPCFGRSQLAGKEGDGFENDPKMFEMLFKTATSDEDIVNVCIGKGEPQRTWSMNC